MANSDNGTSEVTVKLDRRRNGSRQGCGGPDCPLEMNSIFWYVVIARKCVFYCVYRELQCVLMKENIYCANINVYFTNAMYPCITNFILIQNLRIFC